LNNNFLKNHKIGLDNETIVYCRFDVGANRPYPFSLFISADVGINTNGWIIRIALEYKNNYKNKNKIYGDLYLTA